jgi:hypothetical protein
VDPKQTSTTGPKSNRHSQSNARATRENGLQSTLRNHFRWSQAWPIHLVPIQFGWSSQGSDQPEHTLNVRQFPNSAVTRRTTYWPLTPVLRHEGRGDEWRRFAARVSVAERGVERSPLFGWVRELGCDAKLMKRFDHCFAWVHSVVA